MVKLEIQATNIWKSWHIDFIIEPNIWENDIIPQLATFPEIENVIKSTNTRYYYEADHLLVSSFTDNLLNEITSKDGIQTIYIIPEKYHTIKQYCEINKLIEEREEPLYTYLQIEGGYSNIYFLHKTDIKQIDTYYDQLIVDINKAKQLYTDLQLLASLNVVPKLYPENINYRFFTNSSESEKNFEKCYEILPCDLDQYLQNNRMKWVIRSHSSVQSECDIKNRIFQIWDSKNKKKEQFKEKKICVLSPSLEVLDHSKSKNHLSFSIADDETEFLNEPNEYEKEIDIPKDKREFNFSNLPLVPTSSSSSFSSLTKLPFMQKIGKVLINFIPFRWIAQKQANEETATENALYFALAIIAFVLIGLIIMVVVITIKKNKKMKSKCSEECKKNITPPPTSLFPPYNPYLPNPLYSLQSISEAQQEHRPQDPEQQTKQQQKQPHSQPHQQQQKVDNIENIGIHSKSATPNPILQTSERKTIPPSRPQYDSDEDEEDENSDAPMEDIEERQKIDHIIAQQNQFFKQHQRAEYTRRDYQDDGQKQLNKTSQLLNSTVIEKSLGFPSTHSTNTHPNLYNTNKKNFNSSCSSSSSSCPYPNKQFQISL